MNESTLRTFLEAIRATHGAAAQLAERVPVDERFEGQPVWQGEVLVFDLLDHPTAQRCYAWEVDGRVTAVLHTGPVDSPRAAVRAAILASTEETIQKAKHGTRRAQELVEALMRAESQEERERILRELKELAMDQLGVKGTA